ncbi:hypothetical protein MCG98_06315 [Ruminococcus sp. OA3]|uniref:lipopolysaccharide biosynthesis protein n=1 Tax=Ruminococcus sp. OA3 TaxID=2914164 RepID=UPI001F052B4D|nr:hypothetical protein [Ruminococcus sp. OA3]MCH1982178.1 hypothetical protein [Ruminococcus sp. OA3]
MITRIFMPPDGGTMKKTYFWTVLAGMLYAGSSFVMSLGVSNILGAAAAGIFAIAMSIGNQLVTIGYYNMRTFQVSDVLEKYSFGDYCVSRLITTAAMAAAGVIWISAGGYRGEKMAAIALMIGFKMCESVSDLLEGRYQQKNRYDVSCRAVFVKTALYLAGFAAVMLVTRNLLLSVAALGIVYLISVVVIDGTLISAFGGLKLHFSWEKQKSLMISCLPLFVNSFLTAYVIHASKYAIDRYYSNEYLGMFNTLYMMAFVVNLFSGFVLKPLITPLSVKYNDGDYRAFSGIIRRQLLIIGGITFICVAGAYVLGIPVMSWLSGIDLDGHRTALCIILAGGAFTAVYQLLQYAIVIMRQQFACLLGCAVTAGLTFVFTPVLVKRYAIMGGAVSYLCSMALMSLAFLVIFIYYLMKESRD